MFFDTIIFDSDDTLCKNDSTLNEGVLDFFIFFKEKKIKIYLITNLRINTQIKKLNYLGLSEKIEEIISLKETKDNIYKNFLLKIKESSCIVIHNNSKEYKYEYGIDLHFLFDKKVSQINLSKITKFPNFIDLLKKFKEVDCELIHLQYLCKYVGERFDLIQSRGGNISIKIDDLMFIKSSGKLLSDVNVKNGYTIIDNYGLINNIKNNNFSIDNCQLSSQKPSIETFMHSYLNKYVIHSHPIIVNKILVRKDSREIIKKLFPNDIFINYNTPGIDLSKEIILKLKKSESIIIFLANHGILISTNNHEQCLNILEEVLRKCEDYLDLDFSKYKYVNELSKKNINCVSYLSEDEIVNKYVHNFNFKSVFPDKVVFCGINLNENVFLNNGFIYITSTSIEKCREIESVLKAHLLIIDNDNVNYLSKEEELKLINLDSEKYRKNL